MTTFLGIFHSFAPFLLFLYVRWLDRSMESYCRHLEDRIAELESLMGV